MLKSQGHILRADNVKLEGSLHIDPRTTVAQGPCQVEIVEKTPDFAIIEITCSCGRKICVKCNYDDSPAVDRPAQAANEQATTQPNEQVVEKAAEEANDQANEPPESKGDNENEK